MLTMSDVFRDRLEAAMEARGIAKKPLSVKAGLNPRAVTDIFNRSSSPQLSTVIALSRALETTVAYLSGEANDLEANPPPKISATTVPMEVVRPDAAPHPDGWVAMDMDVGEARLRFVMDEQQAVFLRHRLDRAISRLESAQPHPSSISS